MGGMTQPFGGFFAGKRVLLTGHTGFKGSWLSLWLARLGAQVTGLSIDIPTTPSLFQLAGVRGTLDHRIGDINDYAAMRALVAEVRPEIVLHLAAQPLVRLSYAQPLETLATNVMGTAHVLEAVRAAEIDCSIVVITSDKCYANNGWVWGYREIDPMGGHDPYSMSKGAAELVVDSWRSSYFSKPDSRVRLASGRAGNVIGGGDWAADRIIVDCVAALADGRPIEVRNPLATRPWQHVLEPLSGYLWLCVQLASARENWPSFANGWNFGPSIESVRPVEDLVDAAISVWGEGSQQRHSEADAPAEAFALALNCDKAHQRLKWRPVWGFQESVEQTIGWYRAWSDGGADLRDLTERQISAYERMAADQGIAWAQIA